MGGGCTSGVKFSCLGIFLGLTHTVFAAFITSVICVSLMFFLNLILRLIEH